MTIIIDRRKNGSGKSVPNRKKFIDRHKKYLKKAVDNLAKNRKIKDTVGPGSVNVPDIAEPIFHHDPLAGDKDYILNGNDDFGVGDKLPKDRRSGKGNSGKGGDSEDSFEFTLTKEEFFDIYFSNMSLPDFVKNSLMDSNQTYRQRCGYSKDGTTLDLKKTFEQAIGRKLATKSRGKKPVFLDESDLRYKHFVTKPIPVKHAVMFCLMDVSSSMGEEQKMIAKKFFLLLYLFLTSEYESVELVFIRHTHEAEEVDEDTFFHAKKSGGTVVSTAFELVNNIITARYNINTTNFYIAQASDGDVFDNDGEDVLNLVRNLLPIVQYMVYIEVTDPQFESHGVDAELQLYGLYGILCAEFKNIQRVSITDESQVYWALRRLFIERE